MKKEIVKIIIIGIIGILLCISIDVNALNMGAPTQSCFSTTDTNFGCAKTDLESWYSGNNYVYKSPYGIMFSLSGTTIIPKSTTFYWESANLCSNEDLLINGEIYANGGNADVFNHYSLRITAQGNYGDRVCSTERVNGYLVKFTCSMPGGGPMNIVIEYDNFDPSYESIFYVGFKRSVDITCAPNNGTVITNQNQNKNEIINNQELQKQEILYNQNQNTIDVINNVNSSIGAMGSSINNNIDGMKDKQDQTNKELGDLNNNITDSDVSDANSSASDFFNGFESDDFGLSSIITAPLNLIKSITNSTCTPLGFKAPFVDQQVTLPCMNSIYKEFFGNFLIIYQTITFGMVAYWVCVNTFATVKGFKDPDSDRIEVLDL